MKYIYDFLKYHILGQRIFMLEKSSSLFNFYFAHVLFLGFPFQSSKQWKIQALFYARFFATSGKQPFVNLTSENALPSFFYYKKQKTRYLFLHEKQLHLLLLALNRMKMAASTRKLSARKKIKPSEFARLYCINAEDQDIFQKVFIDETIGKYLYFYLYELYTNTPHTSHVCLHF